MYNRLFICFIALFQTITSLGAVEKQQLNSNWKFRQARSLVTWHNASVPGTVHTDLLSNGMIPDPFIGQNERQVQWVDKEDWIYRTQFDLDPTVAKQDNVNLVFEGLDTYADVYLNDSLIVKANNMFRRWVSPVRDILKPSGNVLKIYFHSPLKVDLPKFEALPFQYDCGNDQSENGGIFDKKVSIFARKAGYHYGWDWGPRLVTSGIWRPVYLEGWSNAKIDDIYVYTVNASKKAANLGVELSVNSNAQSDDCTLLIANKTDGTIVGHKKLSLTKGDNPVKLMLDIKNPRLWWCNGLGKPNLYDLQFLLKTGKDTLDIKSKSIGIRKIELVREEDPDGRSFYFKLNGVPVFAKGANYIPCDNFLPRVTDSIYARTINDAVNANMNMLRVWGGGIYENDIFYDLCDRNGIMVWQDFMFACSLYPAEGEMLENIRQEAVENICRLRSHPCLALWCGNNENLEAWYNWGWKRRYTNQGVADLLWKQYDDLYHQLLPRLVARYAPDAFYTPSSPFSRKDGSPEPHRGDFHLWSVWGGGQPVDLYNHFSSRFFSEYGFQSFPEYSTVMKYAPDTTQHFIDSDVMLSHQRGGATANKRIEKYLLDSYPRPSNFKSFLYMTQVLQGDAIKTAMEAHRRNKPYCMGSLFWQHNDCWPVASWSSRDYYGNWKAQHYFAKKAYRDILVSTQMSNDTVRVYVVSDRQAPSTGILTVNTMSHDGTQVAKISKKIKVEKDAVKMIEFTKRDLFKDETDASLIVYTSFTDGAATYDNTFLPTEHKNIQFLEPHVDLTISGHPGNYQVTVSSTEFVRAMCLKIDGCDDYFFEDNYFDLLPGKEYTIKLRSTLPLETIQEKLSWTSIFNATN